MIFRVGEGSTFGFLHFGSATGAIARLRLGLVVIVVICPCGHNVCLIEPPLSSKRVSLSTGNALNSAGICFVSNNIDGGGGGKDDDDEQADGVVADVVVFGFEGFVGVAVVVVVVVTASNVSAFLLRLGLGFVGSIGLITIVGIGGGGGGGGVGVFLFPDALAFSSFDFESAGFRTLGALAFGGLAIVGDVDVVTDGSITGRGHVVIVLVVVFALDPVVMIGWLLSPSLLPSKFIDIVGR